MVGIPETPFEVERLESSIELLDRKNARFRVDPIIEPIGFGFAKSLYRYFETRRRWPDVEIMMGIGNITELTEVDSAGINFTLAAICQELRINSVLTTEVINWAQSSVQEFDLARRQVRYSISERSLPKHVDSRLVMLRDSHQREMGEEVLVELAGQLKDPNYRIFAERGELHVMNRDGYWRGTDPFELFAQVRTAASSTLDEGHAFYIGYELCKAATALVLRQLRTRAILDHPNERSSHDRAVPRGGGIAVMAVVAVGWCLLAWWRGDGYQLFALSAIAAGLAAASFVDDLRGLPALPRLALQTVAVALACLLLPEAPVFQGLLPPVVTEPVSSLRRPASLPPAVPAARAARLRTGFAGLIDKITGTAKAFRAENTREAISGIARDRQQRDTLAVAQMRERSALQERITTLRMQHLKNRKLLTREVVRSMRAAQLQQDAEIERRKAAPEPHPSRFRGPSPDR